MRTTLDRLEQNIAKLDSVTTMLAKGLTPEEMCRAALEGFEVEILAQAPVHYVCNCSKERFARGLLTLGSRELLSLHGDEREEVETVCHYCNKKYVFTKAEIADLARQAARYAVKMAEEGKVSSDVTDTVNDGSYDVPAKVLEPVAVTRDNIDEVIIDGGFHRRDEVYLNTDYDTE